MRKRKQSPTCPRCKSIKIDRFGNKKFFPRWKTIKKGKFYQCRLCGYIKEEQKE